MAEILGVLVLACLIAIWMTEPARRKKEAERVAKLTPKQRENEYIHDLIR